jgi:hypothetical protein
MQPALQKGRSPILVVRRGASLGYSTERRKDLSNRGKGDKNKNKTEIAIQPLLYKQVNQSVRCHCC